MQSSYTSNAPAGQAVCSVNTATISANSSPPSGPTNPPHPFDTNTWQGQEAFLDAIFGDGLATGSVWTTGMATTVGANAEWFGASGLGHIERKFPTMDADLYFCIGLMGLGAKARGNNNVTAQPILIVDDIGTKIDVSKWAGLFALGFPLPTFRIETSPGNQTWGWALDGDASDPQRWTDLAVIRAWLVDMGLTDDVMDAARYVRLPGGWNSKPKYLVGGAGGGKPIHPPVTLVDWQECRSGLGGSRVDLDLIGRVLIGAGRWAAREFPVSAAGRSQASSSVLLGLPGLVRSAGASAPDGIMKLAAALGYGLEQIRPGVVETYCPNMAAHGDRPETGFAFLGDGLMHCNHASCQELSTRDFQALFVAEFDAAAAAAADGVIEGCASGVAFLAREAFPGSDLGGQDLEEMVANAAARLEKEGAEGGKAKSKRPVHLVAADLLEGQGVIPFLDPTGELFALIEGRVCGLQTRAGFLRLAGFLSRNGLDVTGAARNNLVDTLEGRAASQDQQKVYNRVANGGTTDARDIFVNLMDAENRAVHIDGDGWRLLKVSDLPLHLAHRTGGLPLPLPVSANDGVSFMDRLGRHISLLPILRKDDPNDAGTRQRAALLTFIVAQYVRTGGVPHLLLAGEQGGGKTTTAKRLNGLTDPDDGAVVSRLPSDGAAIVTMVRNQSNFVLDNTSGVRPEHADLICSLASGGSQVSRKLYTDSDRSISSALCSIIFTSVLDGGITKRPDLQDRLLTVENPPLAKDQRKSESQLDAAWAADLPHLLADLFDLLVIGLKNANIVAGAQVVGALPPPPRFVDAAQVAEAAAWHGMGWPAGLLTNALNTMRADAAEGQLTDDPIAFRLRAFLRKQHGGVWVGSYDELYRSLNIEDGPNWDRSKIPVKAGLARIRGPLRDLWGVVQTDAGRTKYARRYEFRLDADAAAGE